MSYGVDSQHKQYTDYLESWDFIDDFYKGEPRVKAKSITYLPNPFALAEKEVADTEYAAFKERAPFLAITTRTTNAMTGLINRKPAAVELPSAIEYLIANFNGEGLNIQQHINRTVGEVTRLGRYGLMGELPESGGQSLADNMNGSMPYAIGYKAQDIINWSVDDKKLSLVVLREEVQVEDTATIFGYDNEYQYRVLIINDEGNYEQRLYESESNSEQAYVEIPVIVGGVQLKSIPFWFIGSQNNDEQVDEPPMLPITSANKTVYQYAADARNIAHQTSYLTMTINGFNSEKQSKEFFPNGMCFGTKNVQFLPNDSKGQILQGAETNAASKGEIQAIEQATKLGAELITEQTNQTATAANIQAASSTSQLQQIAQNVEDGYKSFINWVAEILKSSDEYTLEVNKEFGVFDLTVEERAQFMNEVLNGFTPKTVFNDAMRKAGKFDKDLTDEQLAGEVVDSISNPAGEV